MLYNGPITEATQQANHTGLPQVIVVGEPTHHSTFLSWVAANHLEQFAVISVIYKDSEEEKQLDQVVPEKGIVPRIHIIPPQGRGLTPTCLYKDGFKEDIVSQAIATAGGIMMSYPDVVETISFGFVDKEVRNATNETQRTMQRLYSSNKSNNMSSPTAPAATPTPAKSNNVSSSAAATASSSAAVPQQSTSSVPPPTKLTVTSIPPSSSAATTSTLPNVKISLRLADGKTHAVYSNNLWNAATQLAKGSKFCLEMGKAQVQRAYTADELQSLPIVEGAIVRLNLDPPGATPMSSPTNTNDNDVVSRPAPTPVSPPPVTTPTASTGGSIEIRLTLPTGVNQQVTFSPSSTLQDVRNEVTNQFLTNNPEMAAYCQSNGLSNTEFTLVVAYPPKKLENNPETNRKTLTELNLGSKFALRVVMAFLGGGSTEGNNAPAGGGGGGGIMGKVGGWLRGGTGATTPQQ